MKILKIRNPPFSPWFTWTMSHLYLLASHQHFVKKEEKRGAAFLEKSIFNRKRGEKEEHNFGQKKTKTDRHNNTTNSTKLARYQYRLNMN
jgi:hypothetical protein